MITITRRLEIDAGHRVAMHESRCKNLHGHRWCIEVEATAPELDSIGRIIDFGVLKERLGGWLDGMWDHGFILWEEDHEAIKAVTQVQGQKVTTIPWNPTSENIARFLLDRVCPTLFADTPISIVSITVWETPNCRATARVEDGSKYDKWTGEKRRDL